MSIFGESGFDAPRAWHPPQNSRVCGLVGSELSGLILCSLPTVWHVVHARFAWLERSFIRAIWPWHAEHSAGACGGTGACGLWQEMHALSGLCVLGLICGKPVGRAESYAWHTGQYFRSRGAVGVAASGSSACTADGLWQLSQPSLLWKPVAFS